MAKVLEKYLPNEQSLIWIEKWIDPYSVQIVITKGRKAKLGDYRKWRKNYEHKITINYNLPPELFFLTLTHEIAHMIVYHHKSMRSVKPHGKEWKTNFSKLILESLSCYSTELQELLIKFAKNPKASYYGDASIARYFALRKKGNQLLLMNLAVGETFELEKTPYLLIKKKRTRYLCENLINKKKYLINHSVSVQKPVKNESK